MSEEAKTGDYTPVEKTRTNRYLEKKGRKRLLEQEDGAQVLPQTLGTADLEVRDGLQRSFSFEHGHYESG